MWQLRGRGHNQVNRVAQLNSEGEYFILTGSTQLIAWCFIAIRNLMCGVYTSSGLSPRLPFSPQDTYFLHQRSFWWHFLQVIAVYLHFSLHLSESFNVLIYLCLMELIVSSLFLIDLIFKAILGSQQNWVEGRNFPYTRCCPQMQDLSHYYRGTFVITDEPSLTHYYHSDSIVVLCIQWVDWQVSLIL